MPPQKKRPEPLTINLSLVRELLIAPQQACSDQGARLEKLIAENPHDRRFQDAQRNTVERIAAINDVIELLDDPTVRLRAHEQLRQRSMSRA